MKNTLIVLLVLMLIPGLASAQFYYRDIVLQLEHNEKFQLLKKNGIHAIEISSFEADGSATENFSGRQEISKDFNRMTTIMNTAAGRSQLDNYYDAEGRLSGSVDSSEGLKRITEYTYDAAGRISVIKNITSSPGIPDDVEEHFWYYNGDGKPNRMIKVRNKTDSTIVEFVADEQGNIGEEKASRNGQTLPAIFYYYNKENRLTDVARYNNKARRILPDFVFEYDEQGKMSTMLVVPEGSDQYQKWWFKYNEKGLRNYEACYDKKRQPLGRIEYRYL